MGKTAGVDTAAAMPPMLFSLVHSLLLLIDIRTPFFVLTVRLLLLVILQRWNGQQPQQGARCLQPGSLRKCSGLHLRRWFYRRTSHLFRGCPAIRRLLRYSVTASLRNKDYEQEEIHVYTVYTISIRENCMWKTSSVLYVHTYLIYVSIYYCIYIHSLDRLQ